MKFKCLFRHKWEPKRMCGTVMYRDYKQCARCNAVRAKVDNKWVTLGSITKSITRRLHERGLYLNGFYEW